MHFDENLKDATGLNTPSMYGTEAYIDGRFKNAIKLDGASCVQIPYSDNIVFGSGDFTIAGWFYVKEIGNYSENLFSHVHYYNNINYSITGISVYCGSSGKIAWRIGTSASSANPAQYTEQKWTIGEWFHVAMVRKDTTATLYYNGVAIGTKTINGSVYQPPSGYTFKIGAGSKETSASDTPDSRYILNGYVDEFVIAKEALWTEDFEPPTQEYK